MDIQLERERGAANHYFLVGAALAFQLDIHWRYDAEAQPDRARLGADTLAVEGLAAEAADHAVDFLNRTLLLEGRWDELRPPDAGTLRGNWLPRARLAQLRGDAALAWAAIRWLLPRGAAEAPGEAMFHQAVELQQVAVALALQDRDPPAARPWLEAHDRWLTWGEAVCWQSERHALWALYHQQRGGFAAARSHADRALAHATEPRQPLALLAAHRLLGDLDTETGHYTDAATHLAEALALSLIHI